MKREMFFVIVVSLIIVLIYFHPIFLGNIPFPGDLLVGNYEPYKSDSHLGYAPGGVTHKAQGTDVIRQLYPWKYFAVEQLKKGEIPFWNPYNFSGNSHFANFQSGTFYLGNIFFFLFPFHIGWTFYIMLQPFFAVIFTYLFLRKISISKIAALTGGICFAFSGFMMSWLEWGVLGHTILWLPLILYLSLLYLKRPKALVFFLLTFALVCSMLSGYIQLAMYVYATLTAFLIYSFVNDKKRLNAYRNYLMVILSAVIALLLNAVQILPSLELLSLSLRASYTWDQLSERLIPLINLVTIMVPDFFGNPASRNYYLSGTYIERASYIGIISIVFAIYAFYSKNKYAKFFLILALGSYISALDIFPVKFIHALGLPFLSTGVPSRILSIYCFAVSVLAAIGIDAWIKDENRKKILKPFIFVIIFLAVSWIATLFIDSANVNVSRRNLILPTVLILASAVILFKIRLSSSIKLSFLFILILFDLFYYFHKMTPFSPIDFVYPDNKLVNKLISIQGIDRFWGYGSGNIDSNFQVYEKNFSTSGYDPLYLKRYGELLSSSENGKIKKDIPRAVANIAPGFGQQDLRKNVYRQNILNLLGVKYIIHKVDDLSASQADIETFPAEKFRMIWFEGPWQIYENLNVLPRVFLSADYEVIDNKEDIINFIHSHPGQLNKKIVLEENISSNYHLNPDPNAKVSVESYEANKIIIRTYSSADQILFISDNYFPDWIATVDGKGEKIYRANYSFRALPIPEGRHTVVFSYNPSSFRQGLAITSITFGALVLYLIVIYFHRLRAKS